MIGRIKNRITPKKLGARNAADFIRSFLRRFLFTFDFFKILFLSNSQPLYTLFRNTSTVYHILYKKQPKIFLRFCYKIVKFLTNLSHFIIFPIIMIFSISCALSSQKSLPFLLRFFTIGSKWATLRAAFRSTGVQLYF